MERYLENVDKKGGYVEYSRCKQDIYAYFMAPDEVEWALKKLADHLDI